MSLFCVNGQRLKFDLVDLDDVVLRRIKMIILENGGIIEHNNNQSIKFTAKEKFVTYAYPSYKLYNITFIEDCVKNGVIVDPSPYRIGTPMLYDDCAMRHFLNKCNCCDRALPIDIIKTEFEGSINSIDSERDKQNTSQMDSDKSDETDGNLSSHVKASNRPIKNGNQSNQNDESEDTSFPTTEDETCQGPREDTRSSKSRQNRTSRYNKRGRGQQFTLAERIAIVKYLVDNNLIEQVNNGLRVWSHLMANGICSNRTPNSLYRHFRRYILPYIDSYNLTEQQLLQFKKLFNSP